MLYLVKSLIMKYNTGKYLLYLEPSVFVFKRRSRILLYDSESSKKVIFDLTEPLKPKLRDRLFGVYH